MRHWVGVLLAAGTALAVLIWPTASAVCDRTVVDHAGDLTVSTRLAGIVQALDREGTHVFVRTVPAGTSADDRAATISHACAEVTAQDADAVVVVVNSAAAEATVLSVGTASDDLARRAEAVIETRLARGDPDVSSTIAQGLEEIWHGQAARADGEISVPSAAWGSRWGTSRRSRVVTMAALAFTGVVVAWWVVAALFDRRRATAAAVRDAQRARTALIDGYLGVDIAVVQALVPYSAARPTLPPEIAELVDQAMVRAGDVIIETGGRPLRSRSAAQHVVASCAAAEQDLRRALAAAAVEA